MIDLSSRAYIETWYVDEPRFPVAAVSRRLKLNPAWTHETFKADCRELWNDLLLADDFQWWVVQDTPGGSPSIKLHVILAQNLKPTQTVSLLYWEGFPLLNRYRAVCFHEGIAAVQLMTMVSTRLQNACARNGVRCVLDFGPPWNPQTVSDLQPVWVHIPTTIHVKVMLLDVDTTSDEDDPDEELAESQADLSTDAGSVGTGIDSEDSDETSWMATNLNAGSLQPFPPAQGWMPDFVELGNDQVDVDVDDNEVLLSESQWQDLVDMHRQVVGEQQHPEFRVVTHGLGLVSLGRREATVSSADIHVMMAAVADLWSDQAQFAPLKIILVQPQPSNMPQVASLVFIVEVQYLGNNDPNRPCPVLVEESGDPAMIQQEPVYAAWAGFRSSRASFLSSIHRDDGIFPHGVRDAIVTCAGVEVQRDRFVELREGSLCTVRFLPFPPQVANAGRHVWNAGQLFTELRVIEETAGDGLLECRFHGVSPANRPLGDRSLFLSLADLTVGSWYDQGRMLWPFRSNDALLAFSFMAFRDGNLEPNQFVLHFVVSYHVSSTRVPVLVRQTIDSIHDNGLVSEMWAVSVEQQTEPHAIVTDLPSGVFWTAFPERLHVYPRSSSQRIAIGDSFDLNMHTHERFNILMFLLRDTSRTAEELEPETTSLLQAYARRHHVDQTFAEICSAVLQSDTVDDLEPEDNLDLRRDIHVQAKQSECGAPLLDEAYPDAEVRLMQKIVHESAAPCQAIGLKSAPVNIRLDAVLPIGKPASPCLDDLSFQLFTRRNWYDFAIKQDGPKLCHLPDGLQVKPSTYHALTANRDWCAVPTTYLVFVDGSSNGSLATWSFVVVATDGWTQSLVGCAYGLVHLSQADDHWYGATAYDNISAELTALIMAQSWIFKQKDHTFSVICPDLMLSKTLASFQVLAKSHPVLVRLARLQAEWIEGGVQYTHVKGHDAHAWNELADSLAGFALKNQVSSQDEHIVDLHLLAANEEELKWIWMQDSTAPISPCFPPLIDEQGVVFPLSCRRVSSLDEPAQGKVAMANLELTVISANVLALDSRNECLQVGRVNSERTMRLDQQWHAIGAHLVGLQETRTDAGRFQSENFHILASGADSSNTAVLGCELWFSKSMQVCLDDAKEGVRLADCHPVVQHADPRRLFVQFNVLGIPLNVVVLHAPCKNVANDDGQDHLFGWWDQTSAMLHRLVAGQHSILLFDANAPLASDETGFFGLLGAEKMTKAGFAFEQMLIEHRMFVPSTFDWCHEGQTTTWSHPRGCKLRRDYVVVSESLFPWAQSSRVLVDHDNTFAHEDHLPVLLKLKGWLDTETPCPRIKWDYDRMKDPVVCEQFRNALLTLPIPTWDVQVDDHCRIYEDQLKQLGRQFFEQRKKVRKRPTLSEETLQAIAFKRSCLDYGRKSGALHDPEFRAQLKEIEKQIKKMVCSDTQKFFDCLLAGLDDALGRGDFKELYRTLIRFGSKRIKQQHRGRPLPVLKKPDGSLAQTFDQQQMVWLEQFSRIEAGRQVGWCALQQMDRHGLGVQPGDHSVEWFPDELQISHYISKLKRGKAAGPDGIPPDLLKAGNNVIARQLASLFCKTVAHAKEPLAWKGGYQIPLFKKGPMSDPSSYRGIFVSSFVGKLYHASLRAQLLQVWQAALQHQQMGGRPKCGTDTAHLWIQAHSQWVRFQNLPAAWVFFDLRSAFYTVLRQTLTEDFDDEGMVFAALCQMGIQPQEVADMLSTASRDDATQGISVHGSRLINDLLSNTHFWVKGCPAPVKTTRGTRPGDPTGDILFNLAMAVILRDAVVCVREQTDATWLGAQCLCQDFSQTSALPCPAIFDVSYVDDCVFAVHGFDNAQVEQIAMSVVDAMCTAAKRRGLLVNFDAGKTEMVWRIVGPGTRKVKQKLAEQNQCLTWSTSSETRHLRVVHAYKHLGTWFQQGPRHLKEVRYRGANTKSSWGPLGKSFYGKKGVSHEAKVKVFESLTISRLAYNAHVWAGISQSELQTWQNAIKAPLATLCRGRLLGVPPFKIPTEHLAGLLGILPPLDALHVARFVFSRGC